MRISTRSRRIATCVLAASFALGGASVFGQDFRFPVEIELGYRWTDISGNEDMYRTQINDRSGFLLRSLDYTSSEPLGGGLLDFFHIDASDIGAGPAGQFRLQAGAQDLYKFTFQWRETDHFSALPAFANPFLADGIIPGQQTYDRTRKLYDATLELFPGKSISPMIQYTRSTYKGPGRTTLHLGGDDFQLNDSVDSSDDLFRLGLSFQYGPVQGAVTQGWREFRWTRTRSLATGAGDGNVATPILGRDVTADEISSVEENEAETPVTNVWVAGSFFGRLKLIGSYIKADGESETRYEETDAGNFVGFEIARFFAGLNEGITSEAETDHWRGSLRAEFDITPTIQATAGWAERSRTLSGSALIASLYLNTVTFGGGEAGDLLREIDARTAVERDDIVLDIGVTARMLGPFSVNVGWSTLQQEVTATPDASEIIVPGGQEGEFERTVHTFGAGATFAKAGLTLTADFRHDDADDPIFRTDFLDRDRYKFRGLYSFKNFKFGAVYSEIEAENEAADIGYDSQVREFVGEIEVTLLEDKLTLRGAGGKFETDREILIRVPQDFTIVPTRQQETGDTWEGGARFASGNFSIDAAYLFMDNDGSIPFTVDRLRVFAEYFFKPNLGVAFEYLVDQYDEDPAFDQAGPLADYTGSRYYVGLHWRP
jgi:hypothetical protein